MTVGGQNDFATKAGMTLGFIPTLTHPRRGGGYFLAKGGSDVSSGADVGLGKDFWIPAYAGMTGWIAGEKVTRRGLHPHSFAYAQDRF